jgi:hypothetical protein
MGRIHKENKPSTILTMLLIIDNYLSNMLYFSGLVFACPCFLVASEGALNSES